MRGFLEKFFSRRLYEQLCGMMSRIKCVCLSFCVVCFYPFSLYFVCIYFVNINNNVVKINFYSTPHPFKSNISLCSEMILACQSGREKLAPKEPGGKENGHRPVGGWEEPQRWGFGPQIWGLGWIGLESLNGIVWE